MFYNNCVGDLNAGRFCSVEKVQGFATFVVDSLKRVLSSVFGLQNDPEATEKTDYRNHCFQYNPRTYYIPQFISFIYSQCSKQKSSRNFPLFHPPIYNIEYVFSVSTFLKWAERGGGFGSAISVKNCTIDQGYIRCKISVKVNLTF